MTQDMMTLRTLLEKTSDADLLREMIGFTAERLMALEVEGLTGAAHGERSPERTHRNRTNHRSERLPNGFCAVDHREEPGLAAVRRIDDKIGSFLDRPLEGDWPYLWRRPM